MDISDILNMLPTSQVAAKTGVSEADATSAIGALLPTILAGMKANADSGGAGSLAGALQQHTSGTSIDQVDTAEGTKITNHIFGSNLDSVISSVSQATGVSTSVISKVLPALTPIVMGYVSKVVLGKITGGSSTAASTTTSAAAPAQSSGGGIDISNILGGMLGSMTGGSSSSAQSSGGGIGSILGGMLGGGSGGGIGSILGGLGGLLGGGTK